MKGFATVFIFVFLAAFPSSARAELAALARADLAALPYVQGLSSPVAFVQDPSDRRIQYVVEQAGLIKVIKDGVLLSVPFLNLSGSIVWGGERGLLGLAFRPDYATSGRFFVNFTNLQGNTVIARFRRSTTDPLVADPDSRFDLQWPSGLRYIVQPFENHKGGTLAFGPDGYLYIGMGDGGGANDPQHRAQNPAELLGKMLRINVTVPDTDTEGYDIPADNPFLTGPMAAALDEIWGFGLRNPWKFSFDNPAHGGTGALVIADVGQRDYEEVDYEPASAGGRNYGWRNREGAHANPTTFDPPLPPAYTPLTDPTYEYTHADGISITGGYVYRGAALGSSFAGRYFFADYTGRVWSLGLTIDPGTGEATAAGVVEHTEELGGTATLGKVSSFGVDAGGEIYVVSYSRGIVFRIVSNSAATGSEVVMDLGAQGLWTRYNNGANVQMNKLSPDAIATADLDANGKADLIAAFPGFGVWVRSNDTSWSQLRTEDAAAIVAGDLDGDGRADLVIDLRDSGLWVFLNILNNATWFHLHNLSPNRMITADLDGNGRSEVVIDFPVHGVWVYANNANNTSWFQLHKKNAAAMAAGDLDGSGRADVLLDFPGYGIFLWSNNMSWSQLDSRDATVMAVGDVDANGKADAFITFPGEGVWTWLNNETLLQIHPLDATALATADIDGSGQPDVILNFTGWGVWALRNGADWIQLRTQDAEALTSGNLDGN